MESLFGISALSRRLGSLPGSEAQEWHADSLHAGKVHADASLMNALVALHDVCEAMGPTALLPGSHFQTNHLDETLGVSPEIVYQSAANWAAVGPKKSAFLKIEFEREYSDDSHVTVLIQRAWHAC